jgi:mannose-6-phosphate isomerase-like protein (cupin superfamily)
MEIKLRDQSWRYLTVIRSNEEAEEPRRHDMKGYIENIEEMAEENHNFRRVLYTGKHLQLVLMSLKVGEDIGEEIHMNNDQFFRVEKGKGEIIIDGVNQKIKSDDAIVVPAGARHNVINTGDKPLRLYALYGPPNHADGTLHATKADAEASEKQAVGNAA